MHLSACKFRLLPVLVLVAAALTAPRAGAQSTPSQQVEDVVYLKDGSVVRGTIVEQRPGKSILIRTRDGNQFRYRIELIDRMTKEAPLIASATANRSGRKSAGTAGVLSALVVGAGQAYNGEWGKGLSFLGGAIVFGNAMTSAANSDECVYENECGSAGTYAILYIGTAIWSIVDAVKSANRINRESGQTALIRVRPWLDRREAPTHGFHNVPQHRLRVGLMSIRWPWLAAECSYCRDLRRF